MGRPKTVPRIKAGAIEINYETVGQGEPLLLIMGFAMPGAAWVPILPMLNAFRCVYFDNRGTGNSDKPEGPYTIKQMADDASNLLRALDIPKAMVFGVSMGGMIAQELALAHPEQVAKLVLGCTAAGGPTAKYPAPDAMQGLMTGSALMGSNPDAGLDIVMPLLFPEPFIKARPELKQMLMAALGMMPPTPGETLVRLMTGITSFDAYDRLGRIKCPVLIVHGDADVLVPVENAHLIKSRIEQAEVYIVPGAGHAFVAADPLTVPKRIVEFLHR
jgi:pimeloyl-ACP methyl ester carboxylesterase